MELESSTAPAALDHVVAIGASAGGLDALQELTGQLVARDSVAYVVAQHLAPDHPSLLVDLIDRATPLRVVLAADGAVLEAGVIAIAPPNHDITIDGNRLSVLPPVVRFGPSPGIDRLFDSLAQHWGPKAVAVVLSGTGSDGARGLHAVRAAGGLTLVQAPGDAKFDGMPSAAIALGGADLVLAARALGQRLAGLGTPGLVAADGTAGEPAELNLTAVAAQLRHRTGIDVSGYRESVLRRKVERRLAVRDLADGTTYLPLLTADAGEARALLHSLLTLPTGFCLDPEGDAALRDTLGRYLAERPADHPLRVWLPGCGSGEELYGIGMGISAVLGHPADLPDRLKLFGTDLEEASLTLGRRATYPLAAAGTIPADLRSRFVIERPEGIEIADRLRSCAVFARHDVTTDPPFPRLDLIVCRNRLVLFTPDLQARVLARFRYGLLPGGLLVLGVADAPGPAAPGFARAHGQHPVYRRTGAAAPTSMPVQGEPLPRGGVAHPPHGRIAIVHDTVPEQHVALLEALTRHLCHPCLVLAPGGDLLEVVGDVTRYCHLPEGRSRTDAIAFLRPELQAAALALLESLNLGEEPATSRSIRLEGDGALVQLRASPLPIGALTLTALSFLEVSPGAGPPSAPAAGSGAQTLEEQVARLELELRNCRGSLGRSLGDLMASNEELEASTEELQASSEELQSSNEELEAANAELQATNAELATRHQLMRSRGEELLRSNTDLENIQACLSQGMVIVDRDRRVTRFSPLAVRLFALVATDIGKPLTGVPTTLPLPGLEEALQAVIDGEPWRSLETGGDPVAYLVQILPYVDAEGRRLGAIVSLTDVTELTRLRRHAEVALLEFSRLADALEEAVWKRDPALERLLYASQRIQALTGWSPEELLADPTILEEAIDPQDRERVGAARQPEGDGWSTSYRLRTRQGRWIWVLESARVVHAAGPDTGDGFVVGTLADVTERRTIEEHAKDMSAIFECVFDTREFGVAVLDPDYRVTMANQSLCSMVGHDRQSIVGVPWGLFTDRIQDEELNQGARTVLADPRQAVSRSWRLKDRDGGFRWVTVEIRALPRPLGTAVLMVILQDVTELRDSTARLERQARLDAATGLLNRSTFQAALLRETSRCDREGTSLALAWIDLDHFKDVNDQYGHEAGDGVLRSIADNLGATIRSHDVAGRLGGDEFAVIVSGIETMAGLESLLDRLLVALRQPVLLSGVELKVGISIGVALYPADAGDGESLMHAADTAMYSIKESGGNGYRYFTAAMNAAADQRRSLRAALVEAIRREEFELHYQPIVAAQGDAVWGVEALLRWRKGEVLVTAGEFIGFVEESGLFRQLGPLTLRLLRADLQRLAAAGHGSLPVCLNLSVKQLQDPRLRELVESWPTPGGLQGIVIEVVETILLPDKLDAMAALQGLAAQGARISIDDYGTGYSNLRLLQCLRPDFIKIDRSLLLLGVEDERGALMMRSAIEMSHALGAAVVVEGVADAAMVSFSRSEGADLLQGFGIARPMALTDLLPWLAARVPTPVV